MVVTTQSEPQKDLIQMLQVTKWKLIHREIHRKLIRCCPAAAPVPWAGYGRARGVIHICILYHRP